jgi:hypothetical protein
MSDLWLIPYARIRQDEIGRELARLRLVREALAPHENRPVRDPWLFRLGMRFVAWGEYLKKRYGHPQPSPQPQQCCSA